jgi:hypothetical protein
MTTATVVDTFSLEEHYERKLEEAGEAGINLKDMAEAIAEDMGADDNSGYFTWTVLGIKTRLSEIDRKHSASYKPPADTAGEVSSRFVSPRWNAVSEERTWSGTTISTGNNQRKRLDNCTAEEIWTAIVDMEGIADGIYSNAKRLRRVHDAVLEKGVRTAGDLGLDRLIKELDA